MTVSTTQAVRENQARGLASLEYMVVGAVLLVLIPVIGTSTDVGQSMTRGVGYDICRAASGVTGAVCTPPSATEGGSDHGTKETLRPGDDGYNGQTPEEQATNGDYVALGDSYSSVEGAGDYIDDTNDSKSWGFWPTTGRTCVTADKFRHARVRAGLVHPPKPSAGVSRGRSCWSTAVRHDSPSERDVRWRE